MNNFSIEILNKLSNHHKKIMNLIKDQLNNFITNKDIYDFINNYYSDNNLKKAFPIGISINNIIAHDSFHVSNIIKLKKGDFIKIDLGLIESGNIIDSARTFVFKNIEYPQSILDSKVIAMEVEKFIRKELENNGKVSIQRISTLTNALIVAKGYSSLDFLGGHTIEFNKVHGSNYILNKPLKLLPIEALEYINPNAEIGTGEMFAIEIYIPEKKYAGTMIQNVSIPITHYQINQDKNILDFKLNLEEIEVYNKLRLETNNLVYEYIIHSKYPYSIIKKFIEKEIIIKHYPLEFKTETKEKIKYIQYEDCYIILNGELINLSIDSC